MSRLIDADALIEAVKDYPYGYRGLIVCTIADQPTIEPERCQLTDDDKEVIRIHLNAFKEKLCNQYRWIEAQEYEELIDRLMNLQPERKKGKWIDSAISIKGVPTEACSECGEWSYGADKKFCPNCGADMRGEE